MLRQIITRTLPLEMSSKVGALDYQVRWRRKPRWFPQAKSKVFRVPTRPQQDPEEREFLMKQHQHYKTEMKSIRSFLINEVKKTKLKTTILVKSPEQLEAEFSEAVALNNEWNAECSKIREARLEQFYKDRREEVLEKLQGKEERNEILKQKVLSRIEKELEQSPTFITEKNIDQAIELALTNIADYNFAIDLDGNIYKGDQKPNQDHNTK